MGTSTSVEAHSTDDVITSVEAINTPTIDGVITNGEWEDPVLETWMNYTVSLVQVNLKLINLRCIL
ncbi:MAG: hypothetical protein GPJ54_16415 [Candidatus Heimdallarchaeota archaeon]|nr:hypothetical protein [Candidatus Heimdallarchaeota archaeon]